MSQHVVGIKKTEAKKQIIWAEVYAPNRPDADQEYMTAESIETMAYEFMRSKKMDAVDHAHDQINKEGCCVIESFVARKGDPDFAEGAWVVGIHIDNKDLWEKVEKGEINGLSMEALVTKEVKDVILEIPALLGGVTYKAEGDSADDHTHEFEVHYDDEGKFLGGKTDTVDGHFHLIRKGTITEKSSGHFHKFAHTDQLKIIA
jgi:hypothetical protein